MRVSESAGAPPHGPSFATGEFQRRLAVVRESMERRGLDLLISFNPANVCYLTGYDTAAPSSHVAALVPLRGNVVIQVPDLQVATVQMTAPEAEIVSYIWHAPEAGPAAQLAEMVTDLGQERGTIGMELARPEPYSGLACDAATHQTMRELLPEAELRDASMLVLEARSVKSKPELEAIRRAGELTAIGLRASVEAIGEGVSDGELVAAGQSAMTRAGSEISSNVPICMVGRNGGWGPMTPYYGTRMTQGDPAHFEYSGVNRRYNAPAMRTAVVGRPSPQLAGAAELAQTTLEALIPAIRAGRTGGDVAGDILPLMDARDDDLWWHGGFGYSVGLGVQPTWTEAPVYIADGVEDELREGMAFHLPITLTKAGEFSVGFSETVILGADGCEVVTAGFEAVLHEC